MSHQAILYPPFALVLWTFAMAFVMLRRAFDAVRIRGLDPEYFRYGSGYDAPHAMRSAYLLYANLFEMPVLFYLATVIAYVTHAAHLLFVLLAWLYVAARVVHSFVLLDNRNIQRRRNTFLSSVAVLMAIWVVLFSRVAGLA